MSEYGQPMQKPNLSYLKRIVHQGSEGKDVKKLQQRLDTLNCYYSFKPSESLEDTGKFGRKTHNFVIRFQLWAGLTFADGWVDKVTADTIEDFFQAMAQTYVVPNKKSPNPMGAAARDSYSGQAAANVGNDIYSDAKGLADSI